MSGEISQNNVPKDVPKISSLKSEANSSSHVEREEHTVLGRAVGIARDILQGQANSLREKSERASANDEYAKIAADTISSIPKVHIVAAGVTRALALVNPDESFRGNLASGLLNFTEGAALNKVSHINTQGVHGLFVSGAAMGAIRTGFDQNTWHNKDGKFDSLAAAQHLATGTLAGGFLNVPAGLASSHIANRFGAETAVSSAGTRLLASLGSGYVSGSVYGGLDAIVAGGSTKDVLRAMSTGGITGALSGGLVHGAIEFHSRFALPKPDAFEFKAGPEVFATRRSEDAVREFKNPELKGFSSRAQMEHVYDQLAFEPKPRAHFKDLTPRIIPNVRWETATEFAVHPSNVHKVWASEASFSRDLVPHRVDMAVYGARGEDGNRLPIEIHVPLKHDTTVIKPLRALRTLASTELPIDSKGDAMLGYTYMVLNKQDPEAFLEKLRPDVRKQVLDDFAEMSPTERTLTARVLSARQSLDARSDKLTILPEDVLPYLDQSKNVKTIVLSDRNWAFDTWMRQNKNAGFYSDTFTAAATATESTGTITFYKGTLRPEPGAPQTTDAFSDLFNHEDTHLMVGFKPVYDAAHALDFKHYEEPAYSVSDYAKLNEEEDRAESRTAFLQPDPTGFWLLNDRAPLRAAVLARAESANLDRYIHEGEIDHPYENEIRRRIVYAEQNTIPVARAQAVGHLVGGDPTRAVLAAKVLGTIGEPADIPELDRVARLDGRAQLYASRMRELERGLAPKSHDVQSAENVQAHNPANPFNLAAKEAFESIVKLSGESTDQQFQAVVRRAVSDPQLRHLAVEKLNDGSFGQRGTQYADMLRNFGHPKNVPSIIREIGKTKDPTLKSIGFTEVMRLTANQPAEQERIAIQMYHDQYSTLGEDALQVLARLSDAKRGK